MTEPSIVGTWSLVSYTATNNAGTQTREPLGSDCQGTLIYTDNGFMSVHVMSASRPRWRHELPLDVSSEEKVLAVDTYSSYSGTYEQQGERVIHHVTLSLFPNRVGIDLIRTVQLDGDVLTVTTKPVTARGDTWIERLIWRRVPSSENS